MAVFVSKSQATGLFAELFSILAADAEFSASLRQHQLTVLLRHTDPDFSIFLEPDGIHLDEVPSQPVITIKMSCDTAHLLWSGRLLLPVALATGKLRVRGSMAKVIEFAPMLQPAFDRYPELAADAGLTV
jgi:putative sterol carrier protein